MAINDLNIHTPLNTSLNINNREHQHLHTKYIDIKQNIREREWGCTDCIDMVHNRDNKRALVNLLMNLPVL
jgi:hypothetical protein